MYTNSILTHFNTSHLTHYLHFSKVKVYFNYESGLNRSLNLSDYLCYYQNLPSTSCCQLTLLLS